MFRDCIEYLLEGKDLSLIQAKTIMDEIAQGSLAPEEIVMFLTAIRMKRENADEIAGIAISAKEHAVQFSLLNSYDNLCDIVGTGGDKSNTINISTLSGIIAAAAGARVAKHGARAASSMCGSADVLEALGIAIQAPKEIMAKMLDEVGICFMFAPLYHPAIEHVAPIRKSMKTRTLFNILGPLINPAHVPHIVLGVYSRNLLERMADALIRLNISHAMLVWSHDNMDEISVTTETECIEIHHTVKQSYVIHPKDYGFQYQNKTKGTVHEALRGASKEENAERIVDILQGKETGVLRDTAILNAAVLLYVSDTTSSIEEGICNAMEALDSSKAFYCLECMRTMSSQYYDQ